VECLWVINLKIRLIMTFRQQEAAADIVAELTFNGAEVGWAVKADYDEGPAHKITPQSLESIMFGGSADSPRDMCNSPVPDSAGGR